MKKFISVLMIICILMSVSTGVFAAGKVDNVTKYLSNHTLISCFNASDVITLLNRGEGYSQAVEDAIKSICASIYSIGNAENATYIEGQPSYDLKVLAADEVVRNYLTLEVIFRTEKCLAKYVTKVNSIASSITLKQSIDYYVIVALTYEKVYKTPFPSFYLNLPKN